MIGAPANQRSRLATPRHDKMLSNALRGAGVLKNTIVVVVVADHGEGLGQHDFWSYGLLYEEQLRVPLVVAGVSKGAVVRDRVCMVCDAILLDGLSQDDPEGLRGEK